MKKTPLVSITITTKNEEKNIANCLESIRLQSYPQKKIEIIVVDNSSLDKTKEFAKKYTQKVFNKGPERSAQRNFGMIKKSKGKYVMFLDADMILSPTIIEKAVDKLENSNSVACYIPEIILGNSFWNKVRRLERSFYDGTAVDGLRFFKKTVFAKAGGFDEKLTAFEDWDLDKRIKKIGQVTVLEKYNFEKINKKVNKINYEGSDLVVQLTKLNSKAFVYHNESKFNLKNYLAKKGSYTKNFNIYLKKWGTDDSDIKKQLGLPYRFFGVFVEEEKWKKLIRHPILSLGILILKSLIGIVYIKQKLSPPKWKLGRNKKDVIGRAKRVRPCAAARSDPKQNFLSK